MNLCQTCFSIIIIVAILLQTVKCNQFNVTTSSTTSQESNARVKKDLPTITSNKSSKTQTKRESNNISDEDDSSSENALESRAIHRKKSAKSKATTITIPIKNAVVQALTQVHDQPEAEAASHKPSRDSYDGDPHGGHPGDIVYEDELHELEGWIPPPPPPPDHLFHRPLIPAGTFTRLSSIRAPSFMSGRLFGDDFALFLVILTIAGFFGLMLAMFMPFTFLMQQQPYAVASAGGYGYPGYPTPVPTTSGIYGYPYGRRRRSLSLSRILHRSTDGILQRLSKALDQYRHEKQTESRKSSQSNDRSIPSTRKKSSQ